MEIDKARNGDAAAVALLKWVMAALLLLNGAPFVLAATAHGFRQSLRDPIGWNYAAGFLCALCGGVCWAASYAAASRGKGDGAGEPAGRVGSDDRAIAFGGMAIMLWVSSLTCFIIGCEQLSWTPAGAHEPKLVQHAARPEPQPILARSNLIQASLACGRGPAPLHCTPAR